MEEKSRVKVDEWMKAKRKELQRSRRKPSRENVEDHRVDRENQERENKRSVRKRPESAPVERKFRVVPASYPRVTLRQEPIGGAVNPITAIPEETVVRGAPTDGGKEPGGRDKVVSNAGEEQVEVGSRIESPEDSGSDDVRSGKLLELLNNKDGDGEDSDPGKEGGKPSTDESAGKNGRPRSGKSRSMFDTEVISGSPAESDEESNGKDNNHVISEQGVNNSDDNQSLRQSLAEDLGDNQVTPLDDNTEEKLAQLSQEKSAPTEEETVTTVESRLENHGGTSAEVPIVTISEADDSSLLADEAEKAVQSYLENPHEGQQGEGDSPGTPTDDKDAETGSESDRGRSPERKDPEEDGMDEERQTAKDYAEAEEMISDKEVGHGKESNLNSQISMNQDMISPEAVDDSLEAGPQADQDSSEETHHVETTHTDPSETTTEKTLENVYTPEERTLEKVDTPEEVNCSEDVPGEDSHTPDVAMPEPAQSEDEDISRDQTNEKGNGENNAEDKPTEEQDSPKRQRRRRSARRKIHAPKF